MAPQRARGGRQLGELNPEGFQRRGVEGQQLRRRLVEGAEEPVPRIDAEPGERDRLHATIGREGPSLDKCRTCAGAEYGPLKGHIITRALRVARRSHDQVDRYVAVSSAGVLYSFTLP